MRRLLLPLILLLILAAGSGGFAAYQLARPLPLVAPVRLLPESETLGGNPPQLPWPAQGSAAVGIMGMGPLAHSNDSRPHPIASITKIMTAYLTLLDHPLLPGDRGPAVTITSADVATYERELADGQSVVNVEAGETLDEYQLLQALLLPSGNNIADLLAVWDAGSIEGFAAKMNAKATELGMTSTHFVDASGVSPQTVSTAPDLILLAQTAMEDPVFADIVTQSQATLPVAGTVYNVDTALGRAGIVGIKTGSTPEAGGCFVFASRQDVGGQMLVVLGAVLGQDQLNDAFDVSAQLAGAVPAGIAPRTVITTDQEVASYDAPWGAHVVAVPRDGIQVVSWPGANAELDVQLEPLHAPTPAGAKVGTATVLVGSEKHTVDIVTTAPLDPPDRRWRILRPLQEPAS